MGNGSIFRGLDANGDFMYGQGLGSYATGSAALALDIAARLRLVKGSCFFAVQAGVDYTNLLQKGQLKNLVAALQNAILQTPGVVKIVAMPYQFDPATRALDFGPCTVQSIYGQVFIAQITNLLGSAPTTG